MEETTAASAAARTAFVDISEGPRHSLEETTAASAAARTAFVDISEGPSHSLGIRGDGRVYSWGNSKSSNNLGQLGRGTSSPAKHPCPVDGFNDGLTAAKVFVSNSVQKDSGHSAIIDQFGRLWMSGCDRWQQLGLGSVNGGSAGYTWKGGKLWHEKFMLSESVTTEIRKNHQNKIDNTNNDAEAPSIRDVALGADHTLVLSSNKQDVFAFGKCGDGQCGFIGKPYVSAPRKSKLLSIANNIESSDSEISGSKNYIAAVCAIESCSITVNDDGKILRKVGKCTPPSNGISKSSSSVLTSLALSDGIAKCLKNARRHGLIN